MLRSISTSVIAGCRLAEPEDAARYEPGNASHIRVATKYPNLTKRWFENKGVQAECIKLNGAMELAPGLGLAGQIVDLVSSGQTLKDNGLVEVETIMQISARLIVNRAALKTDPRVSALVEKFRALARSSRSLMQRLKTSDADFEQQIRPPGR